MIIQPKLEIYKSRDELFSAAGEKIVGTLESAICQHTTPAFVLTGGDTPRPTYEMLAASPFRSRLNWKQLHLFWGDERFVPPDNPASNYGMAWKAFLSRLSLPPENIHRILGELEDPEEAARRYEAEIRRVYPHDSPPSLDLILLGMGEDGHTASLFPGTVWDETRWVVANYVPQMRAHRITMTPLLLNAARKIIFLVSGPAKARALAGVLEDSTADYPAKRIQPRTGDVTWMVDKAAASLLSSKLH